MGNTNYPEKDGVRCGCCDIGLPPNNGKFHQIHDENTVFYSELENVTVTDGVDFGVQASGKDNPMSGGIPDAKFSGGISHKETKSKANIVSYFKVNTSDTKLEDNTTNFRGYYCLKCYFKLAKEKDLNRLANVLRNFNLDFRPLSFNFGEGFY